MPNGKDIIDDLKFEREFNSLPSLEDKIKFTARLTYECKEHMSILRECSEKNSKRITRNTIFIAAIVLCMVGNNMIDWQTIFHFLGV